MPDEKPQSAAPGGETQAATNGQGGSLLDTIIKEGKMVRDTSQQESARKLLRMFASQVLDDGMKVDQNTIDSIQTQIAAIDERISQQLNAIMHHPDFQTLEAAWAGLNYLVMNTETGEHLKIRLFNVPIDDLRDDLKKAIEFDQSQLFKKVYEEEYGTYGGNPFGLLVGDFEFGRHPQDIEMLKNIAGVAAAAHAPFISAASPRLFDWDSYAEMNVPRDLAKGFETEELAEWRDFRKWDNSRYVALVLPHIMLRLPYGKNTVPVEGFNFEEDASGKDPSKYLWGNAAYALAQRIGNAFSLYRWCAAIRGVEGGGVVEGLPNHIFEAEKGLKVAQCPTEIAITDRREKELSDLGFIALCHCKGTAHAAFFGGQTINKPNDYNTDEARANARLSSMLPYILASARFAHYLKSIVRDKVGSFMTADNVQKYLNTWISDYVLLNDEAPQSVKAKFPLREARVDVTEIAGQPGRYQAVVYLRPHFQLDELSVSLRLVAKLPAPAAA
jgi:type VI secretion system protein ImpC